MAMPLLVLDWHANRLRHKVRNSAALLHGNPDQDLHDTDCGGAVSGVVGHRVRYPELLTNQHHDAEVRVAAVHDESNLEHTSTKGQT